MQKTFLPAPSYEKNHMKSFFILSLLSIGCLGISAQTTLSNIVDPHARGLNHIFKQEKAKHNGEASSILTSYLPYSALQ